MAANVDPIFTLTPKSTGATIVNADSTGYKTIFTAGANGAIVDDVAVVSDDTSAVILQVTIYDGTTNFLIGELSIPAGSGTDGTSPSVNLFNALALPFLQENGGILLAPNYLLKINAKSAVTAAKTVTAVSFGGDF